MNSTAITHEPPRIARSLGNIALQRAAITDIPTEDRAASIVNDALRTPGWPLDAMTREFMRPSFGHDFSRIRVHTDENATESATPSRVNTAGIIAEQGTPLRRSVELTHWTSDAQRQRFIDDYLNYTRARPHLHALYTDALEYVAFKAQYLDREPLPMDRDYTKDPTFIDNIQKVSYDVIGDRCYALHMDGSEIELDLLRVLKDAAPISTDQHAVRFLVFWRDRRTGKIHPNSYSATTTPNIISCVQEIARALPGAKGLAEVGTRILEMLPFQTRPAKTGSASVRHVPNLNGPARIKPLNGTVNVGGGMEGRGVTNLNSMVPHTGGPMARAIPNLIQRPGEEIGDIFLFDSVRKLRSYNLTFHTVKWNQLANGAYRVMQRDGDVFLHVRAFPDDHRIILKAFQDAGFRNVQITPSGGIAILQAIK